MGTSLTLNFRDGNKRTKDQKLRLGVTAYDNFDDRWSYVQFREAVEFGDVVVDTPHTSLIGNSGVGTVTRAQAVGTKQLQDTGEFGTDNDKQLVGAIGYIHGGGGEGTVFYVRRVIDDDTLEIEVLSSPTARTRGGWPVALTTSSVYSLFMPGLVSKAPSSSPAFAQLRPRGVAQAAGAAGEYGYVKQKGWGVVTHDTSATGLAAGQKAISIADGLVQGTPINATEAGTIANLRGAVLEEIHHSVGTFHHINPAGTTDVPVPIWLDIQNEELSYRFPDDRHALNIVEITGSE